VVVAPAPAQPEQSQQTEAANRAAPPAELAVARAPAPEKASSTSAPTPVVEKAASTEDANTKTRDADIKRVNAEKRRAERRQQWADKRQYQRRQVQELRDVEKKVREDTEPARAFAPEQARVEMPRVRFLDADE
jgi:hypothetical protein